MATDTSTDSVDSDSVDSDSVDFALSVQGTDQPEMQQIGTRVFLLEKPRRKSDLRELAKFGAVTYLFGAGERASLFDTSTLVGQISQALKAHGFDTAKDYIAIAGDSIASVLTVLQADRITGTDINLLLYSANRKKYVPRRV